jgi:hypothetical protein
MALDVMHGVSTFDSTGKLLSNVESSQAVPRCVEETADGVAMTNSGRGSSGDDLVGRKSDSGYGRRTEPFAQPRNQRTTHNSRLAMHAVPLSSICACCVVFRLLDPRPLQSAAVRWAQPR